MLLKASLVFYCAIQIVQTFYLPGLAPNTYCDLDSDGNEIEGCAVGF